MQLLSRKNEFDPESEIKGWACCNAHLGNRRLRTMDVREREVCESEIVFQRQICKPLEQLVSSFHSDETIPTESYICRLSTQRMFVFHLWLIFGVFSWWKQSIKRSHFMYSICPLLLVAAYSVSQSSVGISSELLEGCRGAMLGQQGCNDDLHHEW